MLLQNGRVKTEIVVAFYEDIYLFEAMLQKYQRRMKEYLWILLNVMVYQVIFHVIFKYSNLGAVSSFKVFLALRDISLVYT